MLDVSKYPKGYVLPLDTISRCESDALYLLNGYANGVKQFSYNGHKFKFNDGGIARKSVKKFLSDDSVFCDLYTARVIHDIAYYSSAVLIEKEES